MDKLKKILLTVIEAFGCFLEAILFIGAPLSIIIAPLATIIPQKNYQKAVITEQTRKELDAPRPTNHQFYRPVYRTIPKTYKVAGIGYTCKVEYIELGQLIDPSLLVLLENNKNP